jgi:hypothetical protein
MPIAKITAPGLCAIAGSVALLWACLLGEAALMRQASAQRAEVMRSIQMQNRRRRPRNVSGPRLPFPPIIRPAAG